MSFNREFAAVDCLLANKDLETRGVDSFALSIIKMERQLRRLFTFSVFQYPCFSYGDVSAMKAALATQRGIYVEGFIQGFDALHPVSIQSLIGPNYSSVQAVLPTVKQLRNKIFHGQLTGQDLSREDLIGHVEAIKRWCRFLGDGCLQYMDYEGFSDSFVKSKKAEFASTYRRTISSLPEYENLLETVLSR